MNTKWLFWIIFFWCGFFILLSIPEESLNLTLKYILLGIWGTLVHTFTIVLISLSYKNKTKELLQKKEEEVLKEQAHIRDFTSQSSIPDSNSTEETQTDFLAEDNSFEYTENSEEEHQNKLECEPAIPVEPWNEFIRNVIKNRPFVETVHAFKNFLIKRLPNSSGVLYMYNGNDSEMAPIFEYGEQIQNKKIIHPIECASFNHGDLVFHDYQQTDLSGGCIHLETFNSGFSFCMPIEGLEEHFGLLTIYTPELSQTEIETWKFYLKLSCCIFGLYAATQKLNMLFEKHNIRDISTGLFNARHMEESLTREIAAARRHGHSIGVIMIYPDNLEFFLKSKGEKIASQLLWEIGQRLPRYIRTEDIPCRYADNAFCIILPGANQEIVMERAEKIRKEIAGLEIVYGDTILKTTLSIGVSVFPQYAKDQNELIDNALKALRAACMQGENRVISAASI